MTRMMISSVGPKLPTNGMALMLALRCDRAVAERPLG